MNIFLLERPGGILVINDSNAIKEIGGDVFDLNAKGWFGQYPSDDNRQTMKKQWYYLTDRSSELSFHDQEFLPRYLLSFLIFLFVFFILTYLVKDPIPMVDELGFSFLAGFIFNLWWKNKRKDSLSCDKIKLELRSKVDKIPFEELELLNKLELYLQTLDVKSPQELKDFQKWELPVFWDIQQPLARDLIRSAMNHWNNKQWRRDKSYFFSGKNDRNQFKDLSLLAFLIRVQKKI
ncbi:MAG: hypothetical protein PF447_01965 [Spirochaetaceae bacterium]|jgi:hypothetical protein|nr:hypothetical protein [Spirochaetaceae bacterium]